MGAKVPILKASGLDINRYIIRRKRTTVVGMAMNQNDGDVVTLGRRCPTVVVCEFNAFGDLCVLHFCQESNFLLADLELYILFKYLSALDMRTITSTKWLGDRSVFICIQHHSFLPWSKEGFYSPQKAWVLLIVISFDTLIPLSRIGEKWCLHQYSKYKITKSEKRIVHLHY